MTPLPIDPHIDSVRSALRTGRAVVLVAPPGSGKTTRVPPALVSDGPVILLQPRRAAVRSVSARIAAERKWTVGDQIGWQVRFDRRFSPSSQLLVVTEGILTARLQSDPLLTDFRTIVIDEFHERSIYADLALALAKQAWRARDDLRIVVMSATLVGEPVSAFLGGCPIIDVPGRAFPLDITYAPDASASAVIRQLVATPHGDVLCFQPGASEIRRTIAEVFAAGVPNSVEVVPLHGGLDAAEQDRVLSPATSGTTRVIVATNIAETSITVPGVTAVVDSGWQKIARYDAARGIDSLDSERVTQDAADQRAGRAGRVARGRAVRLWDPRDRLRPHREPDIHRVDLAGVVLDILAWGGHPTTFEWVEAPRPDRVASALHLLERIGAVRDGRLTTRGREIHRLPLHPRLASMLVDTSGHPTMIRACALLSERPFSARRRLAATSDLLTDVDEWREAPPHVIQVADALTRVARSLLGSAGHMKSLDEARFRRAVFTAYPDRLARRRGPGSSRVKMASGSGAVLSPDSGVVDAEFIVAVDLRGGGQSVVRGSRSPASAEDSVIHLASAVDPEWLAPTSSGTRCWVEAETGQLKAAAVEYYDHLVLRERPAPVDDEASVEVLADAWLARGPDEHDTRLLRRLGFAGHAVDAGAMARRAARGRRILSAVRLVDAVDADVLRRLDFDAPETLLVPSGRRVRLEYDAAGGVSASVKLQELFGLAETPRIGPQRQPVLLALLSPGGRPVQLTQDLKSFWDRTYPEVRRELRGRYPKHPWPEDPWRAAPTAGTQRPRSRS